MEPSQVPAPHQNHQTVGSQAEAPVPVVRVLSTRGVEYGLMTITLWFGASALIWCLLALASGETGFDMLAFPTAMLVTCLPIFGYLFIRLRKAELANPRLKLEPSKRRWTQRTQFLSFLISFFTIMSLVYEVIAKASGESEESLGKTALQSLAILVVTGGIFAYYWLDEHRRLK